MADNECRGAPFACGVFSILHEATLPRIVMDPASGLIIFNSVVLIRAFPRRLTLRAACGSLTSGYPAVWLPAPLCPISPKH